MYRRSWRVPVTAFGRRPCGGGLQRSDRRLAQPAPGMVVWDLYGGCCGAEAAHEKRTIPPCLVVTAI